MQGIVEVIVEAVKVLGPLGILVISFLGNAIPYSTIPYLIFIINYAAMISDNTVLLLAAALLGGLGAALGKIIVYGVGRAARLALSEESKNNLELFTRIAGKSVFIAVFLFAALPLPDDILYVPLGVTGYSAFKFFIAVALGKIIITGSAIAIGSIIGIATEYVGVPNPIISALLAVILSIATAYVILVINWSLVIGDVEEIGWLKFLVRLFREPKRYLRVGRRVF